MFIFQYHPGTARIILSAPHGGGLKPESIPDRIPGCPVVDDCVYEHDENCADDTKCGITTVTDSYTIEVRKQIRVFDKFST